MCTVYQCSPQKPILHHIYSYTDLKDAFICARRVMAHHYKAIVVDTRDELKTYIGQPSGHQPHTVEPESALEQLSRLSIR